MPITDRYQLSEIRVSIIDIGPCIGSGRGAFNNNFAWSIATRFCASGWTFEGKFCFICDKMTLTVSYFLNTGAKTRWCHSRGASAKIEKTIKIEQAHL